MEHLEQSELTDRVPPMVPGHAWRAQLPWLLLFAAHLPFLVVYYSRLWSQEHYQFFPIALAVFGYLVWQRAHGHLAPTAGWLGRSLVGVDVILLLAGTWLNSPWLVVAGALCLTLAGLTSLQDGDYECSLSYLILLPLLTLRLPLGQDLIAIQWLQHITTRLASKLLHYFGVMHVREGNVLAFTDKKFLVEEACSGVQSLFFLLFLGALMACLQRRKWTVTAILLGCAVGFSAVMNVLRISVIAVAWETWKYDLSVGWVHELWGYVVLFVAAGLLMSADAFLAFLTSPVPADEFFLPALAKLVFWNRLWNVGPREEPLAPECVVPENSTSPLLLSAAAVLLLVTSSVQTLSIIGGR